MTMQRTTMNTKVRYLQKTGALMALCTVVLPDAGLAATDTALLPRNLSPWGMFLNADVVVKAVMIGLAVASLMTWTVGLSKTIELRRATAAARRRLELLERDTSLAEVEHGCRDGNDAVARIIQSAAREA